MTGNFLKRITSLTCSSAYKMSSTTTTVGAKLFSSSSLSLKAKNSDYIFKTANTTLFPHPLVPTTSTKPNLWEAQKSLGRLPIPTIEETCKKYLASVEPFFKNKADFNNHAKLVLDFMKSPFTKTLQDRLIAKDKSAETASTSWIYDWWNDFAYMGYRDPVVVYVSYFLTFTDKIGSIPLNKTARAAALTRGALLFKRIIQNEALPVESARGKPLSMDQFQWLFNTCRIPEIPSDVTYVADADKNDHIIVIRKNKFYKLNTTTKKGEILSNSELEQAFEEIYKISGNQPADRTKAIGTLTADNRDSWTKNRKELILDPNNRQNLKIIESAAFVVCLDETSPNTTDAISRQCWVGDGMNRFFDKTLQFIVFENGKSGILGEHSMMEATPPSYLCNWILSGYDKGTIDSGISTNQINSKDLIQPIEFNVSKELSTKIESVKKDFDALTQKHKLYVQVFKEFGKNTIKKWKVSPDAFAQMVIQLAHFRVHGEVKPTYESATVRRFAFGRTETCRSVSVESKKFVEFFDKSSVKNEEKIDLFRKAVASQTSYMADCVDGRGVDRHFLGLKLLLKKGESVPLFNDEMFNFSKHWVLSTSQISSEYYDGYGWGEVVPNGYGIAYMVNANRLQFNVVSLETMKPLEMREALGKAAHDLGEVLNTELEGKSKL